MRTQCRSRFGYESGNVERSLATSVKAANGTVRCECSGTDGGRSLLDIGARAYGEILIGVNATIYSFDRSITVYRNILLCYESRIRNKPNPTFQGYRRPSIRPGGISYYSIIRIFCRVAVFPRSCRTEIRNSYHGSAG